MAISTCNGPQYAALIGPCQNLIPSAAPIRTADFNMEGIFIQHSNSHLSNPRFPINRDGPLLLPIKKLQVKEGTALRWRVERWSVPQ